jgi:multidrug efflux pump subunit AcrB
MRLAASEPAASRAGLRLVDLADTLRGAMDSMVGGTLLEYVEALPVRVQAARAERSALAQLPAITLPSANEQERTPPSISPFSPLKLEPATAQDGGYPCLQAVLTASPCAVLRAR